MIDIDVALYFDTETRIIRLEKRICLPLLPRVGESIKFANSELGDYFAFTVEQVTHRENGIPEIWATTHELTEWKTKRCHWDTDDLDSDVSSYLEEGWTLKSDKTKQKFQPDGAADRSQPTGPQKNGTSEAAGSGG